MSNKQEKKSASMIELGYLLQGMFIMVTALDTVLIGFLVAGEVSFEDVRSLTLLVSYCLVMMLVHNFILVFIAPKRFTLKRWNITSIILAILVGFVGAVMYLYMEVFNDFYTPALAVMLGLMTGLLDRKIIGNFRFGIRLVRLGSDLGRDSSEYD